MTARALLITGATGKQGGSVVDALLKANAPYEILVLTRDAQSPSSKRLLKESPKIKLVTGNLDAADEIFKKAKEATKTPIWGVFSVQTVGKSEETQGIALIDAALKNGVNHFIFSSVDRGGANSDHDPTNVPHFITKYNIEQHLFANASKGNMTWTVLRPVAFFENLTPNFFGKVLTATWAMRLRKEQKLQHISTSDIGFFAAQSFLSPESAQWKNKSISLAGDALTFDELKSTFEKKTGETLPTTYRFMAQALNWMSKELGYMFTWFRDVGYGADIEECKRINPGMKNFETWLDTESSWKKR
ncbi:NAD(P)-binding protein [Clathrospora elynae]|uniref:NAD(P)-binding protein n=1 Tax=Clathrospora elynae TaxID=706981 RepID=A0A6A5T2U9_9PLEO|nr:NAD(P)-binding protein [Clathrospora elynae]